MSKTTDSLASTCVLCCQEIKIFAIGPCNHPICFKCSTKMRVICHQMYCAVCRSEMPKAIFTNKLHPFDGIISHKFPNDRKSGIFFGTTRIQEEYRKIVANKCQICGIKREPDASFRKLQDHMRKEHTLFFCQLCVDHIKVLPSERKFYTRKELALHRRSGDQDDTSYRGHPLCEFCDDRYFDNDELHRHLRKDHYFCHFCETDGVTNEYYSEYEDLEDHFRSDHFLCEEDKCRTEKFLGAFRSEIDLKAHKAKCHSGKMTKMQAKQTRQVDVEINLPSRQRDYPRGQRDGAHGGGARGGRNRYQRDRTSRDTEMAIEASLETAHREEVQRQDERKKKIVVKAKKEERRTRGIGRRRPDSPVDSLQPKTETKNRLVVEEDKENEILKPGGGIDPISNADTYASNIDKKAPDLADFPTLAEPSQPFQMGGKWATASHQTPDDFPSLGNGDGTVNNIPLNTAPSFGFYSSLLGNNAAPVSSTVEARQTVPRRADDDAEFPTLSSIASLLGGNQKKNTTKKNKNKQPQVSTANQDSKVMNYSSAMETSGKGNKSEKSNVDAKVKLATEKPATSVASEPTTIIDPSASSVSSDSSNSRPPPGFAAFPALSSSSVRAPPPGFSTSSVAKPLPPGFTSLPASTTSGPEFVQPPNFKQRNRDLVAKIQGFCFDDDELFGQFKQDSGEFRQGMIPAHEYYRRCMQTLSEENFQSVFNELVTLLPDLAKQQDLLAAHNDYKATKKQAPKDTVLKISNAKPSKSSSKAWKSSTGKTESSTVCSVCSQIVLAKDLAEHMNVHDDFPALSSSKSSRPVPTPAWSAPSWGRGK
ncbi:E3 ubiquitin-protein ligase ZNF598-like isoform X1 [Lytechinus variegatus]|uniref:E3 ubiquitin-protein ligase ZNF598-like isoform X1 n=1 Tax=Lytechinus variegatus TaxID=7654 RepID=UPI001BB234EA|nr:E3 ubiquitin-protein ligase ZNF598-like isoform X1 [Lytechinus variegatus]